MCHDFARLHLSEQYLTSSQTRAHFLRQMKGRPQAAQSFWGRFGFLWAIIIIRIEKQFGAYNNYV